MVVQSNYAGHWDQVKLRPTVLCSLGYTPRNADDAAGYRTPPSEIRESRVITVRVQSNLTNPTSLSRRMFSINVSYL